MMPHLIDTWPPSPASPRTVLPSRPQAHPERLCFWRALCFFPALSIAVALSLPGTPPASHCQPPSGHSEVSLGLRFPTPRLSWVSLSHAPVGSLQFLVTSARLTRLCGFCEFPEGKPVLCLLWPLHLVQFMAGTKGIDEYLFNEQTNGWIFSHVS